MAKRKLQESDRAYFDVEKVVNPLLTQDLMESNKKDEPIVGAKKRHKRVQRIYLVDPYGELNVMAYPAKVTQYKNKEGWRIVGYGNLEKVRTIQANERKQAFYDAVKIIKADADSHVEQQAKDKRIAELEAQLDAKEKSKPKKAAA